jgi:thiosulfate/3-mercaptopyruvate sulfurtransferase
MKPQTAGGAQMAPDPLSRVIAVLGAALTMLLLAVAPSASASEIVGVDEVSAALQRGAIVWDMRSSDDYDRGHIPGAVNLGAAATMLRNPNTEDFLDTGTVARLMNAAGIDLGREIITYGERGDWAPYWGLITVRYFGGRKGEVFHGGLDDWRVAGRPVTSEPSRLPAVQRAFTVDPTVQINLPEVLARLKDPQVQILDVRTPAEFAGDDIRALRGGHIPGARNIPYQQNWVDPDADARLARGEAGARAGMALKSPA